MPKASFRAFYDRAVAASKAGNGADVVRLIQEARRSGLSPDEISMLATLGEGALQFPLSGPR